MRYTVILASIVMAVMLSGSANAWAAYSHAAIGNDVQSNAKAVMTAAGYTFNADYYRLGLIGPDIGYPGTPSYHDENFAITMYTKAKQFKDPAMMSFALGWIAHVEADKALDRTASEQGLNFNSQTHLRWAFDFLSYKDTGVGHVDPAGLSWYTVLRLVSATMNENIAVTTARHSSNMMGYSGLLMSLDQTVKPATFADVLCAPASGLNSTQLYHKLVVDFSTCDNFSKSSVRSQTFTVGGANKLYQDLSRQATKKVYCSSTVCGYRCDGNKCVK
jgi:hypothetical protein